ncbi:MULTISPECIES: GPP34 family phosphoprotein [unclassified Streptomyces]|uniref:GPP34 family phosphoprotein n=1 Tax=unclassified Streptomyces TaxID=2593676 RepID=UPI0013A6E345|nr:MULTISPECIES: GPP34 family phosphoprotein [unclassified Streptomyces]
MTTPAQLYALCAAAHGSFPPPRRETETGRGLAGAMLLQGVLAGRLDLSGDRVRPTGRGRRGDPVLDAFLARVEASARDREPSDWVERLGPAALASSSSSSSSCSASAASSSRPVLLPGGAGPPAGLRPPEALRRVRRSVGDPDRSVRHAVAAGALIAASGLHDLCWPDLSRREATRHTLRAVAALGPAGLPAARAATAVSRSLSGSTGALAFHG